MKFTQPFELMHYHPDIAGKPDGFGVYITGEQEVTLLITMFDPKMSEIENHQSGSIECDLVMKDGIIMFIGKFGTEHPNDGPLFKAIPTELLAEPSEYETLPFMEEGTGYTLKIVLGDTATGVVMVNRSVELTTKFSNDLAKMYNQLQAETWHNTMMKLFKIQSSYSTKALKKLSTSRFKYS